MEFQPNKKTFYYLLKQNIKKILINKLNIKVLTHYMCDFPTL